MSEVFFDISEILQLGIRIEENGERYYRMVADMVKNAEIKEIFLFLADEEKNHRRKFQEILSDIAREHLPVETYTGEYFACLNAYADTVVFPPQIGKELEKMEDIIESINFAIGREIDSIAYYNEIKKVVPKTQHSLVDKIIEEEKGHFIKLSKLKEEMKKKGG